MDCGEYPGENRFRSVLPYNQEHIRKNKEEYAWLAALLMVSCQLAQSLTRANYTTTRFDTRPALHLLVPPRYAEHADRQAVVYLHVGLFAL